MDDNATTTLTPVPAAPLASTDKPVRAVEASPTPPVAAPANQEDTQALVARTTSIERERVGAIYNLASKLGLERSFADDMVQRGVGLDEARRVILDKVADASEQTRTFPHVSTPLGGRDERVTRRDAVTNALLHRYSPTMFTLSDPAREYRGMTLLELAREFLASSGVNVRGMSRDEIATRSLPSTSDFPEVLSAVTNKTLRQAYDIYWTFTDPAQRMMQMTHFWKNMSIKGGLILLFVTGGGKLSLDYFLRPRRVG